MKNEIVDQHITNALRAMFPRGEGRVGRTRVECHLRQIAQRGFAEGRNHALMGLLTAGDVAEHFGVSPRRARALIANRHKRFGMGMRVGQSWLVHRDDLPGLEPDARYRQQAPQERAEILAREEAQDGS